LRRQRPIETERMTLGCELFGSGSRSQHPLDRIAGSGVQQQERQDDDARYDAGAGERAPSDSAEHARNLAPRMPCR
jgi:hypothetical protein